GLIGAAIGIASTKAWRLWDRPRRAVHPGSTMPISQKIKDLIYNAWTDGAPLPPRHAGAERPEHLAQGLDAGLRRRAPRLLGALQAPGAREPRQRPPRGRNLRQLQGAARWRARLRLPALLRHGGAV